MVWELGLHQVGVPTVLGNIAVNGTNICIQNRKPMC